MEGLKSFCLLDLKSGDFTNLNYPGLRVWGSGSDALRELYKPDPGLVIRNYSNLPFLIKKKCC